MVIACWPGKQTQAGSTATAWAEGLYGSRQRRRSCMQQQDPQRQGLPGSASAARGISGTAIPEPVGPPLQRGFRAPYQQFVQLVPSPSMQSCILIHL